jgi:cobalt-zinc-cadmium efflux system outer membrane protein
MTTRPLPAALLAAATSLVSAACAASAPAGARALHTAPIAPAPDLSGASAVPVARVPRDVGALAPAAGPPSLAACLEEAERAHPELRAARERHFAARERAEQVGALPDPRLGYGEFLEEVQTRTGPQQRRFSASQAFPWPGSLGAREEVADHQARAAWHRLERARLAVRLEVELSFHEYALLGREIELERERVALLRGLEPVVQGRVRAGAGQGDLLRLQLEIGRLEDELAGLEARRAPRSARLERALGRRPGAAPLPLPELVEPAAIALDAAAAREEALVRSPRLAELAAAVEAGREAEELARLARRPGFEVGLDYLQTGAALDPSTPGSGDDPVLLRLGVSLPVWGSKYAAAERESRHRTRALRGELEGAEQRLVAEVEEAVFEAGDAARRLALHRDSLLPRAREALELVLASYRAGEASALELLEAERALLELERAYWRACRDQLAGEARLAALVGGGAR